jgi:predicted nucleic acid-binding Zn ribbon protein
MSWEGERRGWRRIGTAQGEAFDKGVDRADEIIARTKRTYRRTVIISVIAIVVIIVIAILILI